MGFVMDSVFAGCSAWNQGFIHEDKMAPDPKQAAHDPAGMKGTDQDGAQNEVHGELREGNSHDALWAQPLYISVQSLTAITTPSIIFICVPYSPGG